MPLRVSKQGRESSQSVIRRFAQKVRKSGILLEVRKKRFKHRPKSQQLKKRSALRRAQKKQEFEKERGQSPKKRGRGAIQRKASHSYF